MRLAAEGADIVALDLCGEAVPVGYPVATPEDLTETVRLVEQTGRRIVARRGDVREPGRSRRRGGRRRSASSAGSTSSSPTPASSHGTGSGRCPRTKWQAMLDINLSGVWRTFKAAAPVLIEQGRGGSMIAISSVAGLKSLPAQAHYSAAKHGIVGLTKAAAIELGPFRIRVNSIHPWGVDTPMAHDPAMTRLLAENPTYMASYGSILAEPQIADPGDISDAVVWLASDASRAVTGIQLPVDMGATTV